MYEYPDIEFSVEICYNAAEGDNMLKDIIMTDGIEMEYFSFGRGDKPFVILPGIDTKSILLSAKAVEAAYRMFEDDYTVYVFDRRRNMPEEYSIREMADDTAAAMEALGISGAYIFGASQGGMIAMCIAVYFPRLVSRLVLGSTAARADGSVSDGTEKWIELAESRDMTALTENFIDNLYSPDTIGKYKEMLLHMNDNVGERDIERFIIQARALRDFDISDKLALLSCPTLVIGVEGDKVIPPEHSRELAEKIGCQLYMYGTEYGHCVFDEAPDYKQRIIDFFKS